MPKQTFDIYLLTRQLEDDVYLCEALFFPVEWFTRHQRDTLGFRLTRRAEEEGDYVDLTPELLRAPPYSYRDLAVRPARTYFYRLQALDQSGDSQWFGPVEARLEIGPRLVLEPSTPNPFNPTTQIRFDVPRAGLVTIGIFDARGTLVRRLHDGVIEAGTHRVEWNGRNEAGVDAASGAYFVRLEADEVLTRKMTLVR